MERELNRIQQEVNTLHDRSNKNKENISAHEAKCEERYAHIVNALEKLSEHLEKLEEKISSLETLATQGKTSLKTLLFVGSAVGAIIGIFYSFLTFYR